jgi:hypothetical protein
VAGQKARVCYLRTAGGQCDREVVTCADFVLEGRRDASCPPGFEGPIRTGAGEAGCRNPLTGIVTFHTERDLAAVAQDLPTTACKAAIRKRPPPPDAPDVDAMKQLPNRGLVRLAVRLDNRGDADSIAILESSTIPRVDTFAIHSICEGGREFLELGVEDAAKSWKAGDWLRLTVDTLTQSINGPYL